MVIFPELKENNEELVAYQLLLNYSPHQILPLALLSGIEWLQRMQPCFTLFCLADHSWLQRMTTLYSNHCSNSVGEAFARDLKWRLSSRLYSSVLVHDLAATYGSMNTTPLAHPILLTFLLKNPDMLIFFMYVVYELYFHWHHPGIWPNNLFVSKKAAEPEVWKLPRMKRKKKNHRWLQRDQSLIVSVLPLLIKGNCSHEAADIQYAYIISGHSLVN